jgi:periplasmic protein CpxP/Spy
MKKSLVVAIVACTLSVPVVFAQEKSASTKPAMSMDMDKQMPRMQENMKKMQQQMEKLRATTDPKERQKLLQEHMQTMQENMKTMRGMGGPMMTGAGQHGGMTMGDKKDGTKEGDMMKRHGMMETRMDMMQMMMEQMMQRDQMKEFSAPK